MEYIIASLIAILAATLIVYKLANNIFGLGLRLRPLLLCAVCSMFISLVLPKIVVGFAGLPGTLAVLAIFAVVFAYFVAKCEDEPSPQGIEVETAATCSLAAASEGIVQTDIADNLLQEFDTDDEASDAIPATDLQAVSNVATDEPHQEFDTLFASELTASDLLQQEDCFLGSNASGQLLPESEAGLPETDDVILPTINQADLEEQTVNESFADQVDNQVNTEAALSDAAWEEEVTEPVAVLEEPVTEEEGSVSASAVIEAAENFVEAPAEEVTELTPALEQPLTPEENLLAEELPAELPGVIAQTEELEELSETTATEVWQPISDEITGQDEPEQESFLEMPEPSFMQEADSLTMDYNHPAGAAIQFESEALDDLLDFAFISKESQDYTAAFNAFNRALTLYPDSEAAPFLTVEIGNILKNKGAYDEAIKVFLDGRNLSQTRQDEMMEQEFISTIAYLRITKNVLVQNRLGNIPFCEIPPHILDQIDEEFREWRNVGNI